MPTPEEIEAILNGPALPPPNGTVPNFDNPPNNNPAGYAGLTIMLVIATMAIIFRFVARMSKTIRLQIEDGMYIYSRTPSYF
jgi:hypothetical protein